MHIFISLYFPQKCWQLPLGLDALSIISLNQSQNMFVMPIWSGETLHHLVLTLLFWAMNGVFIVLLVDLKQDKVN